MAVQRPEFPCNAFPQRRRQTGLYGAARDCAPPTWGRIGKKIVLRFGELREGGSLQRRPAAPAVFSIQLADGRPGGI